MEINDINTRFTTLDVFRGMTVFLMIVVNTQGSLAKPYAILEHVAWNGCTLADLVFPSFLFAVGNAIAFSVKKFDSLGGARVWYKVLRRSFLIFIIGYLLSWYPFVAWNAEGDIWIKPFAETRILSVLQRIALAYCFSALLVWYLPVRGVCVLCVLLLIGYWGLLYFGGDRQGPYGIMGNVVRKLDLAVLQPQHMYKEKGIAFDPEGLLSTIPCIVNVLAGYLAGWYILKEGKTYKCTTALLITGNLLLLTALFWGQFLPVNKKLWTSSFVLYTIAIDLITVSVLFYTIEIRQWKTGAYFFSVFGKNPLFIYVLSNLIGIFLVVYVTPATLLIDWINANLFQRIAPGPLGCLLFSIFFTMICWSIGWVLDRKKIYIRI